MKKRYVLLYGLLITLFIYGIGIFASYFFKTTISFIPKSFVTHGTMLILSIIAIIILSKYDLLKFPFKKVRFKYYIFGIFVAIAGFIIANILSTFIIKACGYSIINNGNGNGNGHPLLAALNPLQIFLFIFIFASISEEFLFRGVAQNFFEPLKSIGLKINQNIYLSLPVILGGLLFGLAHLILLGTDADGTVVLRIVIMTWFGGTIAGYFQEKHQNILPAIIIHMTLNLPGLIMSFLI